MLLPIFPKLTEMKHNPNKKKKIPKALIEIEKLTLKFYIWNSQNHLEREGQRWTAYII